MLFHLVCQIFGSGPTQGGHRQIDDVHCAGCGGIPRQQVLFEFLSGDKLLWLGMSMSMSPSLVEGSGGYTVLAEGGSRVTASDPFWNLET